MNDPKETMTLKHPVYGKDGELLLERLEFRRLKAADFRKLPADSHGHNIGLLSRATGNPPSVLEGMDGEDFTAAMKVVMRFLGISPETGEQDLDGSPTE